MDRLQAYARTYLADIQRIHTVEDAYNSIAVRVAGIVLVATIVAWLSGSKDGGKKIRKAKKAKKKSHKVVKKKLSGDETIQYVLNKFTNEYEDGLRKLLDNYDSSSEEMQYQRNYYNEMLLHLLLELDGVHGADLEGEKKEQLRLKRKAAIKKIQSELKRLDKL